jgi:carboxymethylenebutenolidase
MDTKSELINIDSGRGSMPCYLARPVDGGHYPGLVVVMEAFGLNSHIKAMADRFASEGFIAISPNLFFREQDNVVAYDDVKGAYRLLSTVTGDQLVVDMNVAIEYLKTLDEVTSRIGTTGFCMGGQVAFLTACRNSEISATVPFYGGGMVNSKHPGIRSPIEFVGGLKAPVLAFFGGRDAFIPLTEVNEFREKLTAAGRQAEVVLFDDADHGFMCDQRTSFHPAHSQEAWEKAVYFLRTHLSDS